MKDYLRKFKDYEPITILLIGSSITSQEWCHPNWHDWLSYTFRQDDNWDECWKRKIINTARDGATFKHFIGHFDSEIARFTPDVVIESLGVNSIHPQFDIEKTRALLTDLNTRILDKGYELVTWSYQLGDTRFHKKMNRLHELHKEAGEKLGYMYIDIHSEFNKYRLDKIFTFIHPWDNPYWGIKAGERDYLHCNPVGNQIIAEIIARKVFQKELHRDEFGTMKLLDLSKYLIEDKSCKK